MSYYIQPINRQKSRDELEWESEIEAEQVKDSNGNVIGWMGKRKSPYDLSKEIEKIRELQRPLKKETISLGEHVVRDKPLGIKAEAKVETKTSNKTSSTNRWGLLERE